MKLTETQKKERLKKSVEAWLRADDVPEKKVRRAVWLMGEWKHEARRWMLRQFFDARVK